MELNNKDMKHLNQLESSKDKKIILEPNELKTKAISNREELLLNNKNLHSNIVGNLLLDDANIKNKYNLNYDYNQILLSNNSSNKNKVNKADIANIASKIEKTAIDQSESKGDKELINSAKSESPEKLDKAQKKDSSIKPSDKLTQVKKGNECYYNNNTNLLDENKLNSINSNIYGNGINLNIENLSKLNEIKIPNFNIDLEKIQNSKNLKGKILESKQSNIEATAAASSILNLNLNLNINNNIINNISSGQRDPEVNVKNKKVFNPNHVSNSNSNSNIINVNNNIQNNNPISSKRVLSAKIDTRNSKRESNENVVKSKVLLWINKF